MGIIIGGASYFAGRADWRCYDANISYVSVNAATYQHQPGRGGGDDIQILSNTSGIELDSLDALQISVGLQSQFRNTPARPRPSAGS